MSVGIQGRFKQIKQPKMLNFKLIVFLNTFQSVWKLTLGDSYFLFCLMTKYENNLFYEDNLVFWRNNIDDEDTKKSINSADIFSQRGRQLVTN